MHVIEAAALRDAPGAPFTEFEGRPYGAGVSFIMVNTDVDGMGPALHQHPYAETFLIHSGTAIFTVGTETLTGVGGQIIVVPAFTPHKFAKAGPERLMMTDVHASDTFITEWLERDTDR